MNWVFAQGNCNVDSSAHHGWEGNPPSGFPVQTHQGGRAASQDHGAVQGGAREAETVLSWQAGEMVWLEY